MGEDDGVIMVDLSGLGDQSEESNNSIDIEAIDNSAAEQREGLDFAVSPDGDASAKVAAAGGDHEVPIPTAVAGSSPGANQPLAPTPSASDGGKIDSSKLDASAASLHVIPDSAL